MDMKIILETKSTLLHSSTKLEILVTETNPPLTSLQHYCMQWLQLGNPPSTLEQDIGSPRCAHTCCLPNLRLKVPGVNPFYVVTLNREPTFHLSTRYQKLQVCTHLPRLKLETKSSRCEPILCGDSHQGTHLPPQHKILEAPGVCTPSASKT